VTTQEIEDPFADAAPDDDDPFAIVKAPAVSFKDAPVGTKVVCRVLSKAKLVQARDFESGDPATWPDGNPKMAAVIQVEVDGERRSVWALKPSSMFQAIGEAQQAAGQRIAPGGTLIITLTGTKPNAKNPKLSDQKLYSAEYRP
jgi:hypothetical protein